MSEQTRTVPTLAALRARRDEINAIMQQHGASNVRVFGSVSRGESTPQSDVDFLVDIPPRFSLLQLSSLVLDLRDLLGAPVEVTSAAHLRDELRPYILRDAQPL